MASSPGVMVIWQPYRATIIRAGVVVRRRTGELACVTVCACDSFCAD